MSQVNTPATLDLNPYFEKIGYHGPREATLEVLHQVQYGHAMNIPFEDLNPLLGIPVLLDIDALQQKLVHSRRGGYCFEHNLLFALALETLGFKVTRLAARVRWNQPAGTIGIRTHMALLVNIGDRQYLADTGFGGMTLTAALLLQPEIIQHTPHEQFRLTFDDE